MLSSDLCKVDLSEMRCVVADLQVEGISAGYSPSNDVLHDVTFSLSACQAMAIQGHNGSGKSTLLRVLSGLQSTRLGKMTWRGRDVKNLPVGAPTHPWAALMSQTASVFPTLTVGENFRLATEYGRGGHADAVVDALPVLKPLWRKRAGLLSWGQRKLLGLGMTLATEAPLLLLDEPLAGLSEANANMVLKSLAKRKHEGAALIIVEHSAGVLRNGLVDFWGEMLEGILRIEAEELDRKEES